MANIKFIGYDGKYPNLCNGNLIIEVDGKQYENISIVSGGFCHIGNGVVDTYAEKGPWKLDIFDLPEELEPLIDEIEAVVNENVEWGCCGGCI